nr:thyrotropin-releasing hormone receptor-like [Cherax quadricarinatus]
MNATQGPSKAPSAITKNLCRFQNVSGSIVLISCTEGTPPHNEPVYDTYIDYDYESYNFTDEQWGIVRQLNTYYVPLLIVVGFVGNLLSCVVFLNTRLRMRSSSYYLAALAIADVTYLFILFLVWLDLLGFNTFNVNVMCQLEIYLGSVSSSLSVWLTVAFTVERFIAVQYPLQRPTVCTVHRAKTVIVLLSTFSVTVHLYVFVTAGVIVHQDESEYNNTSACVPAFVGANLRAADAVPASAEVLSYPSKNPRSILSTRTQYSITKMLLLISTVFIILNLPSHVIRVHAFISSLWGEDHDSDEVTMWNLQQLFMQLQYTHFSINFVFYSTCGATFRKCLFQLLPMRVRTCCCSGRSTNSQRYQ